MSYCRLELSLYKYLGIYWIIKNLIIFIQTYLYFLHVCCFDGKATKIKVQLPTFGQKVPSCVQ
jgi:hypothetical protein